MTLCAFRIISVHKTLNFTHFFQKRDIHTDGRTDGQTDTPSYRDARTHLKKVKRTHILVDQTCFYSNWAVSELFHHICNAIFGYSLLSAAPTHIIVIIQSLWLFSSWREPPFVVHAFFTCSPSITDFIYTGWSTPTVGFYHDAVAQRRYLQSREKSQINPLVLTFTLISLYSLDFLAVALYRMMTYNTPV